MINKEAKEYKKGFEDGVKFSCDHIIDVTHKYRKNILELSKLVLKKSKAKVNVYVEG